VYHLFEKIKSVTIGFENCEVCIIPVEQIQALSLHEISCTLRICNTDKKSENRFCKDVFIMFKDLKSISYTSFGDKKETLFERLTKFSEVTNIYLKYEDGTEDSISVPWLGKSDFFNPSQRITYEKFPNGKSYHILRITNKWSLRKRFKYVNHQRKVILYKIRYQITKKIRKIKKSSCYSK
jgi:hypothetical protein